MSDRLQWPLKLVRAIGAAAVSLLILTPSIAVERPKVAVGQRPPVDQVTVRGGPKLRGMFFGQRDDKSVTLLVSAKWLKGANAAWFETQHRKTLEAHSAALEQALQRLEKELAVEHPEALTAFLKQQREDVGDELDKIEKFDPEFVWIGLTGREAERIEPTTVERRQVLAWAWNEGLDRPETRDADDLQKELKARAVEPVSWPLSLIERFPAREQTDEEWAARMAIVEYTLDKPLDFQGTEDLLVRAGRDVQADLAPLLVGLLRKQLQSQLGDLFGEPRSPQATSPKNGKAATLESLKTAIQTADSEKRRGFRATRMQQSDDLSSVTVTTQFVAQRPDKSWDVVFQHVERAEAKQARPELEKRIQQDPQIKKVLDLTRQLGGAAEEQIQQAIRFGAATMSAQAQCDSQFASFRDRYLKSVVRPPLNVDAR